MLEHASRHVPSALAFHSVPSGEEAVRYLKGEGPFGDRKAHPIPDLVLLDLGLPGMDGFEVLAWIRKRTELQDLKVFIWTDAGQPDVLERATQAGASRFVPKSVAFVRGGLAGLINGMAEAIAEFPDHGVNEPSQPRNAAGNSIRGDVRYSGGRNGLSPRTCGQVARRLAPRARSELGRSAAGTGKGNCQRNAHGGGLGVTSRRYRAGGAMAGLCRLGRLHAGARAGFSLIELLVVIALILILSTMYWGSTSNSRRRQQQAACQSNLQKIYVALQIYANDHGGAFPCVAGARTSEEPLSELVPHYTVDTSSVHLPRQQRLSPAVG